MTKTPGSIAGTSLSLEAGKIVEEDEAGCPDGTTIIVRDLFYTTPARMKFMKSDSVEGGKVAAAVQLQALAHPEVSFTFIRDGKQTLQTPGTGDLGAAVYCVYGRDSAKFVEVQSRWEGYSLRGFVSKPTDARPSRSLQTFFVNDRPVKSKLLIQALEEAYRNQIMVGKFPACVLHLTLPASSVDVNVHPAKTEVKFLSEKAVFDCVHYGVLGALNKTLDRPQVQLKTPPAAPVSNVGNAVPGVPPTLTLTGEIVARAWNKINSVDPNFKTDYFRIMPNHIHGIIIIENQEPDVSESERRGRRSLHDIVRGFKSVTTREFNKTVSENEKNKLWQSSFYDEIIRNEQMLYEARKYIEYNHLKRYDGKIFKGHE